MGRDEQYLSSMHPGDFDSNVSVSLLSSMSGCLIRSLAIAREEARVRGRVRSDPDKWWESKDLDRPAQEILPSFEDRSVLLI